jgi:hypothetical protein
VEFRHSVSRLKGYAFEEKVGRTSISSHITAGKKRKEKNKETHKTNKEMKSRETKKHAKDVEKN